MSESFLSSSKSQDFDDDSDIVSSIENIERENSLKEEKEALEMQNSTLKAQFEQAISLANQSKVLQSELIKEKEEKRQLYDQIEILKTQIELLASSNNDANNIIEEERKKIAEQVSIREEYSLKEQNKLKNQFQMKIEKLEKENNDLRLVIEDMKEREFSGQSEQQNFLGILSKIYKIDFNSYREAVSFIEKESKSKESRSRERTQMDRVVYDLEEMQKKYSCERKKRKQLEKLIKLQEMELDANGATLSQFKEQKDIIEKLKSKTDEMEEDKSLMVSDFEHQIKLLKIKNEKLIQENNELRKQKANEVVVIKEPIVTNKTEVQPMRKEKDCDVTRVCKNHKELSEANCMLLAQLEEMRKSKAALSNDLERMSLKQKEDEEKVAKLFGEKEILLNKCKVYEMEMERIKEMEESILALKKQINTLRTEKKKVDALNEQQFKEIQEHKMKNSSINADNAILNQRVESYKEDTEKLTNEIMSLEEKLNESNNEILRLQQLSVRKAEVKVEEIPSVHFKALMFDDALNSSIERIAITPSLQSPAKIQAIYRAISKYIEEKSGAYEDEIFNLKKKVSDIEKEQLKCATDISIILSGKPDNTSSDNLVQSVKEVKQERDQLLLELNKSNSVLDSIVNTLQLDSKRSICEQIDMKAKYINKLECKVQDKKRKIKKLCKGIKTISEQSEKDADELNAQIERQQMIIEEIKKKHSESLSRNKETRAALNAANERILEIEAENEEKERKITLEHENKLNELKSEHLTALSNVQNEKESVDNEKQQLNEKCKSLEENILNLKKAYESQKVACKNLNDSLSKMENDSKATISNLVEKFHSEKQQMEETYANNIQTYSTELKSLKQQIEIMQNQQNEFDSLMEKQTKKSKKLKENIKSLESEVEFKDQEIERTNQIVEATKVALKSEFDSKLSAKLNEQKYAFGLEKRKIFTYVSEKLTQNTDTNAFLRDLSDFLNHV